MDFLDDLQLYNDAMFNAYDFITGRTSLESLEEELSFQNIDKYPLPFDPYEENGRSEDVIDIVISHLTTLEEYEKCAELVKIKNACQNNNSEIQTD